jgi:hypothetical protein
MGGEWRMEYGDWKMGNGDPFIQLRVLRVFIKIAG